MGAKVRNRSEKGLKMVSFLQGVHGVPCRQRLEKGQYNKHFFAFQF